MSRVTEVKKAQKDQGQCGSCQTPILAGQPYVWTKTDRFSARKVRCTKTECRFRPSDLTANEKLATLYAHQEDAENSIRTWAPEGDSVDSLKEVITDLAERVREVAQEYEDGADNIEDGFQHETQQSEEMRQHAEDLNSWADELESNADNLADFDPDGKEGDDLEDAREAWLEEQRGEAENAIEGCPL